MKKQLLLLVLSLSSYLSIAQIPDSEKQALFALYDSLNNGVEWPIGESLQWNSANPNPVSDWYGITIEDDHVTEIYLGLCSLNGMISSEIGALTELKKLKIACSQITGSIPPEIGNLTKLTSIDLSGNNFIGSIPSQIGSLTELVGFYLQDNQFSGVLPPEIGSLSNLEDLFLWNNQFSGAIPPELGLCTKLSIFSLENNNFTGEIPMELSALTQLISFFVSDNQLTGNVTNIYASWPEIAFVYIGNTGLTGDIDLSTNTKLVQFNAVNTSLSSVNVKNGFNFNLGTFKTINCPNLTCIQVDNPIDAANGENWYQHWETDNTVTFSEDCSTLSISNYVTNSDLLFYPNPTTNYLFIDNTNGSYKEIEIYNILGKKLFSSTIVNNTKKIDFSNFENGVYIMKSKTKDNIYNIDKVIKN